MKSIIDWIKNSAKKEAPSLRMLSTCICFIIGSFLFITICIIDDLVVKCIPLALEELVVFIGLIVFSMVSYIVAKVHIRAYQRVFSETIGENGLKDLTKWKRYVAFIRQAASLMAYHWDGLTIESIETIGGLIIWAIALRKWL